MMREIGVFQHHRRCTQARRDRQAVRGMRMELGRHALHRQVLGITSGCDATAFTSLAGERRIVNHRRGPQDGGSRQGTGPVRRRR